MVEDRKIALETVSTDPPRRCGIGTFNRNFLRGVRADPRVIWHYKNSIVREKTHYSIDSKKSTRRIYQDNARSWRGGLDSIVKDKIEWEKYNSRMPKYELPIDFGVVVQLEYGIFEDNQGRDHLIPLLRGFKKNNITNILIPHTVLENPQEYNTSEAKKGDQYERIMKQALNLTDQVICLTPSAIDILEDRYDAPRELLKHVDHGINQIKITKTREELEEYFGVKGRTVVTSGGFFTDGKDHSTVLEALARTKRKDILYLIAGITHPDVVRYEGEKYRESMIDFSNSLGLKALDVRKSEGLEDLKKYNLSEYNVVFLDCWLNDDESLDSKVLSKLILIANKGKSQISSGEIARALEARRIYIATESPYSRDMAKEGIGFTVEHGNIDSWYRCLNFVLNLPSEQTRKLELASATKGSTMYWPDKSREIINILGPIFDDKRLYGEV